MQKHERELRKPKFFTFNAETITSKALEDNTKMAEMLMAIYGTKSRGLRKTSEYSIQLKRCKEHHFRSAQFALFK
jgi:hypothetical protein